MADRLDRLDRVLAGDVPELVSVHLGEDGTVSLAVDSAMAEARLCATALKGLIAELRQAGQKGSVSSGKERPPDGVSDLTERINARRGSAAG